MGYKLMLKTFFKSGPHPATAAASDPRSYTALSCPACALVYKGVQTWPTLTEESILLQLAEPGLTQKKGVKTTNKKE